MIEHTVAGERVVMLPEKALFWRDAMTLFVADFHLGKAAAFRDAGIPMPPGTTTDNVERLASAVEKTGAERIVFLGDFIHARQGRAEPMVRVAAPPLRWWAPGPDRLQWRLAS